MGVLFCKRKQQEKIDLIKNTENEASVSDQNYSGISQIRYTGDKPASQGV